MFHGRSCQHCICLPAHVGHMMSLMYENSCDFNIEMSSSLWRILFSWIISCSSWCSGVMGKTWLNWQPSCVCVCACVKSARTEKRLCVPVHVFPVCVQEGFEIWVQKYEQRVEAQRSMMWSKACTYIIQTWAHVPARTLYYCNPSPGCRMQTTCNQLDNQCLSATGSHAFQTRN